MPGSTITAECEGVECSIEAGILKWADMFKHYPSEDIDTEDLYDEIGGGLPENYNKDPNNWENSCVIRMSRGLNYSGVLLPSKTPSKGGAITGKDGYNYWVRVRDMKKFLENEFGTPNVEADGGESAVNEFKHRKGIIAFDVVGWSNSTGHVTLWDGTDLSYAPGHNSLEYHPELYYFQMKYIERGKTIKTTKVYLWELI